MSNTEPGNRKAIGVVLAAAGAILFVFAVVRLNSVELQLVRGLGESDRWATIMLLVAVPMVLGGLWQAVAEQQPDAGDAPPWPPKNSWSKDYDGLAVTCSECGIAVPEPHSVKFLGKNYCPEDYHRALNG